MTVFFNLKYQSLNTSSLPLATWAKAHGFFYGIAYSAEAFFTVRLNLRFEQKK